MGCKEVRPSGPQRQGIQWEGFCFHSRPAICGRPWTAEPGGRLERRQTLGPDVCEPRHPATRAAPGRLSASASALAGPSFPKRRGRAGEGLHTPALLLGRGCSAVPLGAAWGGPGLWDPSCVMGSVRQNKQLPKATEAGPQGPEGHTPGRAAGLREGRGPLPGVGRLSCPCFGPGTQ